jgi:hypothetical protein
MYLANLTVLTDTRFPNEGSGYKEKVLSLGYKDLKQISKTELICMSLTALDLFQFTGIINTKDLPYLLDQVKEYL